MTDKTIQEMVCHIDLTPKRIIRIVAQECLMGKVYTGIGSYYLIGKINNPFPDTIYGIINYLDKKIPSSVLKNQDVYFTFKYGNNITEHKLYLRIRHK